MSAKATTIRPFDCPCTWDVCRDAWCTTTLCAIENLVIPEKPVKPLWEQVVDAVDAVRHDWEKELQEIILLTQNGDITQFQTAEMLRSSKTIPQEYIDVWVQILCGDTLCGLPQVG